MSELIEFIPLTHSHFIMLVNWLNEPHVQDWWSSKNKTVTFEEIERKLGPRVDGKEQVFGYIIEVDQVPIGYIQVYNARLFPREGYDLSTLESDLHDIKNLASIDLYIGDPAYLHKGYGTKIILQFLDEIVFHSYEACIVDPDVNNRASIRGFEKSGFKALTKIIIESDTSVLIMIKRKNESEL